MEFFCFHFAFGRYCLRLGGVALRAGSCIFLPPPARDSVCKECRVWGFLVTLAWRVTLAWHLAFRF